MISWAGSWGIVRPWGGRTNQTRVKLLVKNFEGYLGVTAGMLRDLKKVVILRVPQPVCVGSSRGSCLEFFLPA